MGIYIHTCVIYDVIRLNLNSSCLFSPYQLVTTRFNVSDGSAVGFIAIPRLTPDADYMNFDNILWALLVVFQCMTMEGKEKAYSFNWLS